MSQAATGSAPTPQYGPPLPTSFYARPADVVAPDLLGKYLLAANPANAAPLLARIVETEAYVGQDDLACHAAKGLTPRTSTIFGPPGHAYVYLIYGIHDMFNVVAERQGVPHAVLVRAVELFRPTGDASLIRMAAKTANGPGKLTKALGITRAAHNGLPLDRPPLSIHDGPLPAAIAVTARVGVAYAGDWAAAPLRFFERDSPAVSRPAPGQIGCGQKASRDRVG